MRGMGRTTLEWTYKTPEGFDDLKMTSDGTALTELRFVGARGVPGGGMADHPVFRATRRWLDVYFSGRQPDFTPPYRLVGATPFREEVSREMLKIPFGATATYGEIAATLARRRGIAKMSARAVGGAVGWNPICIIVPCHRVMGARGAVVGYGGGIRNKIALLGLEAGQAV